MPALPATGNDGTVLVLAYRLAKRALGVLIMTSVKRNHS